LYYMNEPMFRHDKPQAGRYREHHQFGCEALGETDPAIDAEMIGMLFQVYTQLGLKHIRVYINSIGDGNCRPQYIEALKDYYRPLLSESCSDCQVRFYKNPLRLLDCKEPQDQPKIAKAPKSVDYLCDSCRAHFTDVKRFLESYQVPFSLDPLLVRGLDYYTRTVFEFTSEIDKQALNGGGRYDGLAEILGGQPTPGIGFGAGIERIILELKRQGITPPPEQAPRIFVVYFDKTEALKNAAVQITAELRHAGIKAEMSYGDRSRKAQMKQANTSGAAYAILLKEDELANDLITVKDMQAEGMDIESKQLQVPRDELLAYFNK
ncbi:MAG: histidine--tRNA ligase, partial [Ktedonobacteraceae bacterium]|nr:histidine--tRNA ligase [Ktedonobacteraceae bacterium]